MPRFAPNLSTLFTEAPFLERFALARDAGFDAVEFQFPYAFPVEDIARELTANDLELVLFNLPAGDWDAGDRGLAAIYERRNEFREGISRAIAYARVLQPHKLNCLAGHSEDTPENDLALLQNVRIAASELADNDLDLTIEPVNTFDVPDFALPTSRAALDVIDETDADNLSLQLDVYHAVRMGEDPLGIVRDHLDAIGHIQIADVPGRHEPLTGDIDFRIFLRTLDELGYEGFVGLEYTPATTTQDGLELMRQRGILG